ncbi:MAG TPA: PadR family transcriptional regulator [Acholeplasmataceae bacterium]|jgi:DNA-binding PadR family transcriptional regulator|nr:PadR family transcriptional regulator [Acholeplasmataceae bacterium]
MSLTGDFLRGHTDAIILSLLEKEDSYGYMINREISEISNHEFMLTEATLYTAFKRLEKEGLITSYWKEGHNNLKRKYYSITNLGRKYLFNHRKDWKAANIIINKFLEGENGTKD